MPFLRSIIYFLIIVFLEIICGVVLAVFYWVITTILFGEKFGLSTFNEFIYYLIILLPPFLYCWAQHKKLKKEGIRKNALIYGAAGLVYLIGGFAFLLVSTGFHLFA